jgi:uncharacterized membrane protein YgcG
MKRRTSLSLCLVVALHLVPSVFPKSYSAPRFDSEIVLERGGTLNVTETVEFRFQGGPFTYAFREIPLRDSDGIENIRGFLDGEQLTVGSGERSGLELERRGPAIRATWHFPPVSDATRTFVLQYRVQGAVRRATDEDLLLWKVLPNEHDYRIESSRITLVYPNRARLAGAPVASRKASVRTDGGRIVFESGRIGADSGLRITVPFTAGDILSAPPAWQRRDEKRKWEVLSGLGTGVLFGSSIILLGGLLVMVRRRGIKAPTPVHSIVLQATPPDDLPPALVGALWSSWNDWRPAFATLIDLARRGFVEMEPGEKPRWGAPEFTMSSKAGQGQLSAVEQLLLAIAFSGHAAEQRPLAEVREDIAKRQGAVANAIRDAAMARGLLDRSRMTIRSAWMTWGIVMLALGTVVACASLVLLAGDGVQAFFLVLAASVAGAILGLIVLIVGLGCTNLSDAGLTEREQWLAFRRHLQSLIAKRSSLRPELLEEYLPYAIALGLGEEWAKAFKGHPLAAPVSWLEANQQGDGSEAALLVAVLASSGADGGSYSDGGVSAAAAGGGGGGASGAG